MAAITIKIFLWWILALIPTSIKAWSSSPAIVKSRIERSIVCHNSQHAKDDPSILEETNTIPILYESNRLLVINKPPGIAHHNDDESLGIVNTIREQRGERLWGVHRLDRVTSGILIFAKDADMAQALTASFATGDISKVYLGISKKRPIKKKQGLIQGGMVRSRDKSWRLTRTNGTNVAKTRFFTAPIQSQGEKLTLLLFRPYTGKTHQLRVAAKSVGLPLWGDPTYKDGTVGEEKTMPNRTYLHASGVLIPPLLENPESIAIWCPPPFDDVLSENKDAITNLMRKHCNVPQILEAMENSRIHTQVHENAGTLSDDELKG